MIDRKLIFISFFWFPGILRSFLLRLDKIRTIIFNGANNRYNVFTVFLFIYIKENEGGLHMQRHRRRNTPAFTVLAYFTFIAGVSMFCIGLYNADNLQLNEKGYILPGLGDAGDRIFGT